MKLKIALLPLLIIPFLTSCSKNEVGINKITYGTLLDTEAREIDGNTLVSKMNKENFLIAVHPDPGSCSCWTNFNLVLSAAAKRFNLLTYKIHYSEINEELYNNGNGFLRIDDAPTFYIVLNGKIHKRFLYPSSTNSDDDIGLFFNEETLKMVVEKYCTLPTLYFVNEGILDEKIKNDALVYYIRESCPDCSFATPNVLKNYFKEKNYNNKIYVFDLDPFYNKEGYQELKDKFNLSNINNEKFGYNKGVVPTFQYYKNGVLTSACVYFNENEIAKKSDGTFYIKESYFSETRVKNLEYTNTVLDGTIIPSEYIAEDTVSGYIGIKNDQYHASLYDPILTSFLDMYLN